MHHHICQFMQLERYLAEPIADLIAVIFTSLLFFRQFKKAMHEIEKTA